MFQQVSEKTIRQSEAVAKDVVLKSNFTKILQMSDEFKVAGLNPIFLYDDEHNRVMVTSWEWWHDKFH